MLKKQLKSIGFDIVEQKRFERLVHQYKDRFLEKIFAEKEIKHINKGNLSLLFAVKEAVLKCFQKGLFSISLKNINIKDIEKISFQEDFVYQIDLSGLNNQGINIDKNSIIEVKVAIEDGYAFAWAFLWQGE